MKKTVFVKALEAINIKDPDLTPVPDPKPFSYKAPEVRYNLTASGFRTHCALVPVMRIAVAARLDQPGPPKPKVPPPAVTPVAEQKAQAVGGRSYGILILKILNC